MFRPWIEKETSILLNHTRINTIVMFMSYWSTMTPHMQKMVVRNVYRYVHDYGRFVWIGDGSIERTTDHFQVLLESGSKFLIRQ